MPVSQRYVRIEATIVWVTICVSLFMLAGTAFGAGTVMDDETQQPEELPVNPAVTQANIHQTICVPLWTRSIRPSAKEARAFKEYLGAQAGIPRDELYKYELDHKIPLELGGAARDLRNMELEPWAGRCGAKAKDRLENEMARRVCAGSPLLVTAQYEIWDDWLEAYERYIDPVGCLGLQGESEGERR